MKLLILTVLMLGLGGCMSAQRAQEIGNAELAHEYFKHGVVWGSPSETLAVEVYLRGGFTEEDWMRFQTCPKSFVPSVQSEIYDWLAPSRFGRSGTVIFTPHGSATIHSGGGYVSVR